MQIRLKISVEVELFFPHSQSGWNKINKVVAVGGISLYRIMVESSFQFTLFILKLNSFTENFHNETIPNPVVLQWNPLCPIIKFLVMQKCSVGLVFRFFLFYCLKKTLKLFSRKF